jgi:hypothetical protein
MSKQMRMIVAGASLLAVALLVWALRLRPPADAAPLTTTDPVSTFAQTGTRGSNGAASGRSGRAENASRSRRGESTPTAAGATAIDPTAGASGASTTSGASRGVSAAPGAPLESVTVGPTYDASDSSVTAPVLLSPLVPRSLAQARPNAPAGDVRILINEGGTVESVRATVDPKTMGEAIIITNALSMAKTWRFQPATKDGKPVRYSLMVPLSRF